MLQHSLCQSVLKYHFDSQIVLMKQDVSLNHNPHENSLNAQSFVVMGLQNELLWHLLDQAQLANQNNLVFS